MLDYEQISTMAERIEESQQQYIIQELTAAYVVNQPNAQLLLIGEDAQRKEHLLNAFETFLVAFNQLHPEDFEPVADVFCYFLQEISHDVNESMSGVILSLMEELPDLIEG